MDIIVGKGIKLKKDDFLIFLSDLLDELYKGLNAEIDLSVRIVKKLGKNLNKDETIYAGVNYKCGKYYLDISKEIYKHYIRNDFYRIEAVLYHEFVHLYDILHLQKYASKIFIDKKHNSLKSFFAKEGYNFWTEVNAYYLTFDNYGFKADTLYKLSKRYKRINKERNNLFAKEKPLSKDFDNLDKSLMEYEYNVAKHIAYLLTNKSKIYPYKESTLNLPEVKKTLNFMGKCHKYCLKIDKCNYNKRVYKRLCKLGKYIYNSLYFDNGVVLIEKEGSIETRYYKP